MAFVHGGRSSNAAAVNRELGGIADYDDDLGAVTVTTHSSGGRSGTVIGGVIPKTSVIRAAVARSGGDPSTVRGPTRAPTFTPPPPPGMTTRGSYRRPPDELSKASGRALVPRDRPDVAGGNYGGAGAGDFQPSRFPLVRGESPAMVYGAPGGPIGVRRAFRTLSDDERSQMRAQVANDYGLSGYDVLEFSDDDLAGFSLKGIGKALTNVKNTVVKAVKDTGHAAGTAVTSKIGQAVIGTGLALTGVGLPAAAAIGAAAKAGGELIKPGGNLGKAARGAVTGAATGVAAVGARTLLTKAAPGVLDAARGIGNKLLPGNPFKRVSTSTADTAGIADRAAEIALAGGALTLPGVQVTPSRPDYSRPTVAKLPRDRTPASGSSDTKKRVAEATINAGKKAKGAADAGAGKLDELNAKIDVLAGGLEKARAAGDAIGADKISQMIADAQSKVAQVSSSIAGGGEVLRTAGAAAEGAAIGATAGAAGAGVQQWISDNPGKAAAIGIGALGAIALVLRGRGSSSSSSAPAFAPPTFSVSGGRAYRRPRGAR